MVAELEELFIFRLDTVLLFPSNVVVNEEVNAPIGVQLGYASLESTSPSPSVSKSRFSASS